ncbi:MAG TPA: DUF481 domain-containing protein [Cellvibrionaceae bacterium]
MKTGYLAAVIALSTLTVSVAADEDRVWSVTAELGAISTSGNTEGTTVNGKLTAKQELERWHNEYVASALYKEDEFTREDGVQVSEVSAEKYFLSAKSAYQLSNEHGNLFVFGSHTHDEFGAYRKYTVASAGYGLRLIDGEAVTFDAEIGPGYYWGEKVLADDIIEKDEGAMLRAAADFVWRITENAAFNQKLAIDAAEDNTRYVSDTSVSTKISDRMQMKVGYSLTHNTDVAPGKEGTDTTTYINLVYNF